MKVLRLLLTAVVFLIVWTAPTTARQGEDDFAKAVSPLLTGTCTPCHNDRLASGGLNVTALLNGNSVIAHRDDWEKILRRVRASEMPPSGVARPSDAVVRAFTD